VKVTARRPWSRGFAALLVAGGLAGGLVAVAATPGGHPGAAAGGPLGARGANPVVVENRKAGFTGWRVPDQDALATELLDSGDEGPDTGGGAVPRQTSAAAPSRPIEGFASAPSVDLGGTIDLYVSGGTVTNRVDITISRQGWYGGNGAQQYARYGNLAVGNQPVPTPDPTTGRIEASAWPLTQRISIPADGSWPSGVYLAGIGPAGQGPVTNIVFVVRDDASTAAILVQLAVNTYQAYNPWGGKSLYDYNSTGTTVPATGTARAAKVSFLRPYQDGAGTGLYFSGDVFMVKWLEQQGYDVTYATSVDMDENPSLMQNHKVFLSDFHDEYWSLNMRTNLENAIAAGRHAAFFDANSMYWQVRYEASSTGAADRTLVGYKYLNNGGTSGDPVQGATTTVLWRNPPVNRPENAVLGSMFDSAYGFGRCNSWVVTNASHWLYKGTGLVDGATIPYLVGYEWDNDLNPATAPGGVRTLSNSAVLDPSTGIHGTQQASVYTAPSGAIVFDAGTIYWPYFLFGNNISSLCPITADGRVRQMTRNVLDTMLAASGSPVPISTTTQPGQTTTTAAGTTTTLPPIELPTGPPETVPTVPPTATVTSPQQPAAQGYGLVADDGRVFSFGAATFTGDPVSVGSPVVAATRSPAGGYWLVTADGHVVGRDGAPAFGDLAGTPLTRPIVGIAATPSGQGYWLVASDGGIFGFGDAVFLGSTGAIALNQPIVGMAVTRSGQGYWLVASDGGIFGFGDAVFRGSTGAIALNQPIEGMAPTSSGDGYWLVASDGGIFSFGGAPFLGSTGAITLNRPIAGMVPTPTGLGYWLVADDGGMFAFGDATFQGSVPGLGITADIVGAVL
jgi:hypothetical protein